MSSLFRFPPQARLVLAAIALFLGAVPACGGIVRISDGTGGTGGMGGFDPGGPISVGNTGGVSTEGTGGEAGAVPVYLCGNGLIDTGEECDGPSFNGKTCSTETMGADTAGVLFCTTECLIDTSGCVAGGGGGFGGGFGGTVGVGGSTAVGGQGGTFGGGGTTGLDGEEPSLCIAEYIKRDGVEVTSSTNCGPGCNCQVCTAPFAACLSDDGCLAIFVCAEKSACSTDASCYSPSTCQPVIDQWGGQSGYSMTLFDSAATCSLARGCQLLCLPMNLP